MLRLFFFVMTYATDYERAAEFVRTAFSLGLLNAGVLCVAGTTVVLRRGWRRSAN